MSTKDDGATPVPTDEASLQECPLDGGSVRGKHKWIWTDGIHVSFKQHCINCGEARTLEPKRFA